MVKVYILQENDVALTNDEWKEYVCENFDDNCVVTGNRRFKDIREAYWYLLAIDVIKDLGYYDKEQFMGEYEDAISLRKINAIYDEYMKCDDVDDNDFIASIAEILYDIELETGTIRGYSQGDWQNVIYVKDSLDVKTLETYYFGKLTTIKVEEDGNEYFAYIPDDTLWEWERTDLKKGLKEYLGINEEIKVFNAKKKVITDYEEIE